MFDLRETRPCRPGLLPGGIQCRLHSGESSHGTRTISTASLFITDVTLFLPKPSHKESVFFDQNRKILQTDLLRKSALPTLCFCRMGRLFLGDLEVSTGKVRSCE